MAWEFQTSHGFVEIINQKRILKCLETYLNKRKQRHRGHTLTAVIRLL